MNKAKEQLIQGSFTCVLCSEDKTYTATNRGIAPVLAFLESGEDFSSFFAADKVVGRATAFLYVLLRIRGVYAPVMSQGALDIFRAHDIPVEYDTLTDVVLNHKKDGLCPMEAATQTISQSEEALAAIRATLERLRKS